MAGDRDQPADVVFPEVDRPANERLSIGVAESIKQMIRSEQLRPGDRLPNEATLCEHFGVSRITLREAIQMLRALGLVEPTRGRGTYVRQPDPESFLRDLAYFAFADASSVEDLFEVRGLLECHAVRRATERGDAAAHADLLALVEEGRELLTGAGEAELAKVSQKDTEFHLKIVVVGGNLVLEQMMHRVLQILEAVRQRSLGVPGQAERSWRQHREIAQAIADGDSQLAVARMVEHMAAVKSVLTTAEERP